MCKLVPMTFPTGVTANVADIKVDKLKKYLTVFPKLSSFEKVYLFGSTLEEKCRNESDIDFMVIYNDEDKMCDDMTWVLPEIFPEYVDDDFLRTSIEGEHSYQTGAARKALSKGVLIYERN